MGDASRFNSPEGGLHLLTPALPAYLYTGADPGLLKRGSLGLQAKKKGGSRRGSNFGLNVKKPTSWAKRGGGCGPPGSAHDLFVM